MQSKTSIVNLHIGTCSEYCVDILDIHYGIDVQTEDPCYRLALALAWPGCLLLSSGLFLLASVPLWRLHKRRLTTDTPDTAPEAAKEESPEATQPLLDVDEANKE